GMSAMDYAITDPWLDPPGQTEAFHSERVVRLPETYWCYPPCEDGPEVNELPALTTGHVTFACVNNFSKVSAEAMGLWNRIMQALPQSRLMVAVRGESSASASVIARMGAAGID